MATAKVKRSGAKRSKPRQVVKASNDAARAEPAEPAVAPSVPVPVEPVADPPAAADDDACPQATAVEAQIGHKFKDIGLLALALCHASLSESRLDSNERMEFLGDAVLGLVACSMIFKTYPDLLEGDMTKIKSAVVSRQTCAQIAKSLNLDARIKLGKGMQSNGQLPSSLGAAAFEAVVAAIYLDAGYGAAHKFLEPILAPIIRRTHVGGHQENFKSILQQYSQRTLGESPSYLVLDDKGPDHAKCFEVCVELGTRRFPSVWGQSKKQAEQQAAILALEELRLAKRDPVTGDVVLIGEGPK
jgi:ribonuclease-3